MTVDSGAATGRLALAGIALEAMVYGLFAIFSSILVVYLFGNIGIKRRFIYIGFIALSLMLATVHVAASILRTIDHGVPFTNWSFSTQIALFVVQVELTLTFFWFRVCGSVHYQSRRLLAFSVLLLILCTLSGLVATYASTQSNLYARLLLDPSFRFRTTALWRTFANYNVWMNTFLCVSTLTGYISHVLLLFQVFAVRTGSKGCSMPLGHFFVSLLLETGVIGMVIFFATLVAQLGAGSAVPLLIMNFAVPALGLIMSLSAALLAVDRSFERYLSQEDGESSFLDVSEFPTISAQLIHQSHRNAVEDAPPSPTSTLSSIQNDPKDSRYTQFRSASSTIPMATHQPPLQKFPILRGTERIRFGGVKRQEGRKFAQSKLRNVITANDVRDRSEGGGAERSWLPQMD